MSSETPKPTDGYLIRKRGLYYRPKAQGYTASWHDAGRYTLEDARSYTHPNGIDGPRDGMDYFHESEAPDRPAPADEGLAGEARFDLAHARDVAEAQILEDIGEQYSDDVDPGAFDRALKAAFDAGKALGTDHTALQEAWAKRTGTVECTGGDQLPHLKIYFDKKEDMAAFDDAIRNTFPRIDQAGEAK